MHSVLMDSVSAYTAELEQAQLPQDPKVFRSTYSEVLPRFEAHRLSSTARNEIARHLSQAISAHLVWKDANGEHTLDEALNESVTPLQRRSHRFTGTVGWSPAPVYRGRRWQPDQLGDLGAELVSNLVITEAAGDALAWVARTLMDEGKINLSGRKIVVFGGNAEMAPTRSWLAAGADVLWLDVVPPPENWLTDDALAGTLYWPADNADLLTQPREILATVIEFSGGEAMDLGLYAYAPGSARELRLTGVMNAIVNAIPAELIASVTMLISPTTPTELNQNDLQVMNDRRAHRPAWEAALSGLGLLGRGRGCLEHGGAATTRTVVPIQGMSYQAAQYLGKVLMAETWTTHGAPARELAQPLRVSANTATITKTRSLDHPVFAAAFGGAAAFGVETFTPRQSRTINGLLALRDWHYPNPPVPGEIRVHGGIHTLPYPLEIALRVAAGIGFVRSPRLLRGLLTR